MRRDRRHTHLMAAGLAAAALLLTSCSSTDQATNQASDQTTVTVTPTPTPEAPSDSPTSTDQTPVDGSTEDDLPAFPENTEPQEAEPDGSLDLVLQKVRVGKHRGFDRIVLEFSGNGRPGWRINYVDRPRQDGSGTTIKLNGTAFLDIYASGTTYPAEDQQYYDGPKQFQPTTAEIKDVFVGGTFEGYTQVVLGVASGRVPFRTFGLADPSRLVVDVRSAD